MIKEHGLLYPPTLIAKTLNKQDKSRLCEFHNTHGHTTAQCRDLKNQVKDLVRNQYLDNFIKGSHRVADLQHRPEEHAKDVRHEQPTVRIIARGPTLAGDSNMSRKSYSRYGMTNRDVLFNVLAAKQEKTRQVPII